MGWILLSVGIILVSSAAGIVWGIAAGVAVGGLWLVACGIALIDKDG